MVKKTLCLIIILCVTFSLVGCKELVSTEYKGVKVEIVNEYSRGMYTTPIWTGKFMVMQTHPAVYEITVEYEGENYTITGSETYNKYSDKVGTKAIGTLEIRTYDDGSVRNRIVELQ